MHQTIGTYTLCLNEAMFMGPHLESWLPHVDEMVLFDGGSTDGTLAIIKHAKIHNKHGAKIRLFENRDPKDLTEDYVRVFNECLHSVSCDMAIFAHIDMMLLEPGNLHDLGDAVAASMKMRSYAGDPDGAWFEIDGRGQAWKNIIRLRTPDLGAHYFGHYGAQNEDCYFREITGDRHEHYGTDFARYPYRVVDSGAVVMHFSDVRPMARRMDRMVKSLINQGHDRYSANAIAAHHPRVEIKDGMGMKFRKAGGEAESVRAACKQFSPFRREVVSA